VTAGVRGLLNKLLTVDMYRRPAIADVLADTWVQSGGPEDFKPVTKHQTSTSSATTAASSNARSSGLIPDEQQWADQRDQGKGAWAPPDTDDVEEAPVELKAGADPAEDQIKPGFAVEEEAIAKLERLGYAREEIIRQLQEEGSHLYKLYFRFLKALNAWGTK
jgi:hypothetical protein